MEIVVGARSSPLSLAQVREVEEEIKRFHPKMAFRIQPFLTTGDQNLVASLKSLEKTNFFTKEIDEALQKGDIDIAVHSAKDLPDPLPEGLSLYAMTKGVDARDSLVLSYPDTLLTLKKGARIGTSSLRREQHLLSLRPDLEIVDIRGPIQARLALWEQGRLEGVVIAEAALIRLGLTGLHREILTAPTAPYQGRLAVVGRIEHPLELIFQHIDNL